MGSFGNCLGFQVLIGFILVRAWYVLCCDQGTITNDGGELCGGVFSLLSRDYRHVSCFPGMLALV